MIVNENLQVRGQNVKVASTRCEATKLMRTIIERYGDRSTSKLWSNHDSSVLRGSFLVVQLETQYPQGHFDGARVDTQAFQAMRDAMGPVKIN